jgi:hypothetical protein
MCFILLVKILVKTKEKLNEQQQKSDIATFVNKLLHNALNLGLSSNYFNKLINWLKHNIVPLIC